MPPLLLEEGYGVVVEAGILCRRVPTTPPSAHEKRPLRTVSEERLGRPESNGCSLLINEEGKITLFFVFAFVLCYTYLDSSSVALPSSVSSAFLFLLYSLFPLNTSSTILFVSGGKSFFNTHFA